MLKLKTFVAGLLVGCVSAIPLLSLAELPDADKLNSLRRNIEKKLQAYQPLVNGGGKCLEVTHSDLNRNGGRVQIWDCNSQPQQIWKYESGRYMNSTGKCLDVAGSDLHKNGGHVQIWDCNNAPNQQWGAFNGRLRNGGGKCLDVSGPDLHKNGGHVQVWDCNNAPNQQWH